MCLTFSAHQCRPHLCLPAFQVDWWDVWQHMVAGVQVVAVARVALDDTHGQVVAAAADALAALAGCSPCEELLHEACRPGAALGEQTLSATKTAACMFVCMHACMYVCLYACMHICSLLGGQSLRAVLGVNCCCPPSLQLEPGTVQRGHSHQRMPLPPHRRCPAGAHRRAQPCAPHGRLGVPIGHPHR